MKKRSFAIVFTVGLGLSHRLIAQNEQTSRAHADHYSDVNRRGDDVMGFSHQKATHHFRLFSDGGSIEVQVNDVTDSQTREQIRTHLAHIAQMFTSGNFNAPMLIHARNPPGVPVLQKRRGKVTYRFEDTELGSRIRITTQDRQALEATHSFLRFQIAEHHTGDPNQVSPEFRGKP